MAYVYRMTVEKINAETGEREEVLNDNFKGFTLLADHDDDSFCEVIMHDDLMNIANKIVQSEKCHLALKLANTLEEVKRMRSMKLEDLLMNEVEGGNGDG